MPNDLVDKTPIMPGRDKGSQISFKDKIDNIKQLGEQDTIFDLVSTNRSHWMMALSKAKIKMGFQYKHYLCGTLFNMAVFRPDFNPEVEFILDILKLLGHSPQRPLNFGYLDQRVLKDTQKPFVLYFNGASQPRKILSKEQMHAVLERVIQENPNHTYVYLEGKNEIFSKSS